ncbi:MAG TPA: zf-HC2 domain-containing protein [Rhizomicrobium sp.]|nr:zf-HC2 domain-containing protein [Rhizomicrobium sp.]
MSCNEALRVQAYFDGELDAAAALDVEKHLETCADCAPLLKDLEVTRNAIRSSATYHRMDDDLRRRITGALDRETGTKAAPETSAVRPRRSGFLIGALGGAGGTALAAALGFMLIVPPASDLVVADVMNAHLRSMMSDHLIDVVSTDHHTVKPWFAGHSDISPPVADFGKEGFKLVGGRVDYVDGHRSAVVVYKHGAHVINVFAWAADGTGKLPDDVTRNGYHMVFWKAGDLDFCAVSDTGVDELGHLVRLLKQTAA